MFPRNLLLNEKNELHNRKIHISGLFEKFGFDEVFGRSAVMELLELKASGASKLLSNVVKADIIEPVSGHGKGKYKFNMKQKHEQLVYEKNRVAAFYAKKGGRCMEYARKNVEKTKKIAKKFVRYQDSKLIH